PRRADPAPGPGAGGAWLSPGRAGGDGAARGGCSTPPASRAPGPPMTTRIRPLALALGLGLAVAAASPAAGAQRKRAGRAPAVPAQCTDFYAQANADWLQAHPASAPDAAASALAGLAERALQQQRVLLEA